MSILKRNMKFNKKIEHIDKIQEEIKKDIKTLKKSINLLLVEDRKIIEKQLENILKRMS